MQDLLLPGICLVAATTICCAIISIYSYDRLVVRQRTKFEETWRKDGEPRPTYLKAGLVWNRSLRSGLASQRCSFVWSWSTPRWVEQDPIATDHHRRLRISALVSTAVLVAAVFVLAVWH